MLTILGLLNQYVGFFNVNTKFKGCLYTVLGFGSVWYILYIGISFITAHRYLRGFGLVAAFIGLMYVIYLNFMYYFTEKKAHFDISPHFEKVVGNAQTADDKQNSTQVLGPSNGVYREQQVLPTAIKSNSDEIANIQAVAQQMLNLGLISQDYQKMSDRDLRQQLVINHDQPIYANHPGSPVPFAKLVMEGSHLVIYGGINEMQAVRLGEISRIGLADVTTALKNSDVFLASIIVNGGLGKTLTRSSFIETAYPYTLKVEVAYRLK